jgi:transposase
MARSGPLLSEAQWKKIAPLLPKPRKNRRGGRPWIENRRVLEGILWILRSGARWQDLPEEYPHPSRFSLVQSVASHDRGQMRCASCGLHSSLIS